MKPRQLSLLGILSCSSFFMLHGSLQAQTHFYVGPDNGLWSDAGNWSTGQAPNSPTESVIINQHSSVLNSAALADVLIVGDNSTAGLKIENGGSLTTNSAMFGFNTTGSGVVSVDGFGSQLHSLNFINVGNFGHGELSITNGGLVESAVINIGAGSTATGSAYLSGVGTQLLASTNFAVGGHDGSGELQMEAGSYILAAASDIGSASQSIGNATVTGQGTVWDTTGELVVGRLGQGNLSISNGGVVRRRPDSHKPVGCLFAIQLFFVHLANKGSKNPHAFFSFLYATTHVLPSLISSNERSVRTLKVNQEH